MSDSQREIAILLGQGFVTFAEQALDLSKEGLERGDGPVVFGADVELRAEQGVIVGKLVPRMPVVRVVDPAEQHFVLDLSYTGQLEFVYGGTLEQLKEETEKREAAAEPMIPDDESTEPASDNAVIDA